jgi:NAD+ kinase
MPAKTIGLIAHTGKPGAAELVNAVAEEFSRFKLPILFEKETAKIAGRRSDLPIKRVAEKAELLVVLGGDGTLLNVAGQLGDAIKPIFGINVGSLGFLTCVNSSAYREAVESIARDRITFSRRTLLDVTIRGADKPAARNLALNDAVFGRGEESRLIRLSARLDGEPLTEFNADGLIVATPTGSTAYSLSAGGPILAPESGVLVITPICPHVLTNRSIIVAESSLIEIEATERDYPVFLSVDGRESVRLKTGVVVAIRKSKTTLQLAALPDMSFFSVVRQKLKWSGSNV